MKSLKVKPLGDRVLVEPLTEFKDKTRGGIIIPETVDKERPEKGRVLAVGEGKLNDEGKLIPLRVKKGQTVIFTKYGPDEVKIEGKEYFILSESHILAILED